MKLLEVQPGGWLLLSLLCFFLDFELFIIVIFCIIIHESGHLFFLERFQARVRRITLDLSGLTIHYNTSVVYGVKECLLALGGPMAGVMAAVLSSFLGNFFHSDELLLFAGANAVLSVFNLLPAKPLDGWRFLNALSPAAAQVIGFFTSFIVLIVGVFLMYAGYGTTFAVMGIVLMLQDTSKRIGKYRIAY